VFRYVAGLIDGCAMLAPLVESRTAETINLTFVEHLVAAAVASRT
jgi:hypothetical protein